MRSFLEKTASRAHKTPSTQLPGRMRASLYAVGVEPAQLETSASGNRRSQSPL